MAYTAQPPAPPTYEHEFKVVIRSEKSFESNEWDRLEQEIAEAVAARLALETTADYQVPF